MERPRIMVLAGGWSRERDVSLNSGKCVFENLPRELYQVEMCDPASDLSTFMDRVRGVDLVINLLHGKKGEDGCMQGLLEILGIRYLGSGVLGSAIAMDKSFSKLLYRQAGLKVPEAEVFKDELHGDRLTRLKPPYVVKPVNEGSSFGLILARDPDSAWAAIREGLSRGYTMMVEEYIGGRELTCCVMGNEDLLALPIVEIRPLSSELFDYRAKYEEGKSIEICPAEIQKSLSLKAQETGIVAHRALGLKAFSRTDMILRGEELYVLETNTLPGMTERSLFPLAARAMGWSMPEFLKRLVELGLRA